MPESVKPSRPGSSPAPPAGQLSIATARRAGRQMLAGMSATPGLDADLLLELASGHNRTSQIAHANEYLEGSESEAFMGFLRRRAAGEPIAYILGKKSFRTLELAIDRRVLVPRPETELLVEVGLKALGRMAGQLRVVDVGTGSGAVALALAAEISAEIQERITIIASDISQEAIEVAAKNRLALEMVGRVELVESDLLNGVRGAFDLILANLPYLRSDQRHPSTADEPELALYAGTDGLDLYRRLLPQAGRRLRAGGVIACEIDPDQSYEMQQLAHCHVDGKAGVLRDLSGQDRIVIAGSVDIVRTVTETWPYGA
jgi:release factor glutamine methyltransferase